MAKRFGRRRKAKLLAEIDAIKDDLKYAERDAQANQTIINNAPNVYRVASELCQIAANINPNFSVVCPKNKSKYSLVAFSRQSFDAFSRLSLDTPVPARESEYISMHAAQIISHVEDALDNFGVFKKMITYTFRYGRDRSCMQLTAEALKHSSIEHIAQELVKHMVEGINRYQGD